MFIRCAIMAPPPPKIKRAKTIPKSGKYYTIHSHPNSVFGVRADEKTPTCMVGFKNFEDAQIIGRMIETYYINHQELPVADSLINLKLPSADESVHDLKHLILLHNDTQNLLAWCAVNFLQFLAVDEMIHNTVSDKYSWGVSVYQPDDDFDMFRERLDYIFNL